MLICFASVDDLAVSINGPRIILWDLETLPIWREVMRVFPGLSAYPGLTLKANINSIICAGWKVYGEKRVHCINAWDFPNWVNDINDDFEVCKAISEVVSGADCIVTHNGRRFDWKFLQTRLVIHRMPPLPMIKHVDTCAVAKRHMMLFNNRLNTLASSFTGEKKMEHEGWELWEKVKDRDPKAMKKMEAYCKQDVRLLENIFKQLLPFIKDIPNYNMFRNDAAEGCPKCGSFDCSKEGTKILKTYLAQRYRCKGCYTIYYKQKSGHQQYAIE